MRRLLAAPALLLLVVLGAGCGGALEPAGEGASKIAVLWWVMLGLTTLGLVVVLAFVVAALVRRRSASEDPDERDGRGEQRTILLGGVLLPIVILVPIVALTIWTGREVDVGSAAEAPLEIRVVGHQFWWDIAYPVPGSTSLAGATFRTANELHIPVGRPVELQVTSSDVIHSIWIPELQGKIDMIPGRENRLLLEATEPGVFTGRCAELCGDGHARMRFVVVAHEPAAFEAWQEREAAPAVVEPDIAVREEFANSCAPCHMVRGVFEGPAFAGVAGPDLTHLAARRMIGANLLPNTAEGLGRWIVDPQGVKPGNRMPDVGLGGDELDGVIDFLLGLE